MLSSLISRIAVTSTIVLSGVMVDSNALAATHFTANPSPLVAGQSATITVVGVPNRNTFIVMPGADFVPLNGNCYNHLRMPAYYMPANIWHCADLSAPIAFSSPSVAPLDLIDGSPTGIAYARSTGYVGFIATGGVSRGAWTVSSPTIMYDQSLASSL
ncbi:hypothetical protein HJC99_05850 [Candidatus Saccharibacteria bacterium]|nr:hypothetical protein [Candidatus Saccharibacteria bacterium]